MQRHRWVKDKGQKKIYHTNTTEKKLEYYMNIRQVEFKVIKIMKNKNEPNDDKMLIF